MAGPPPQAGVLEGANPVAYNASSPITLFIIQVSILQSICPMESEVTASARARGDKALKTR